MRHISASIAAQAHRPSSDPYTGFAAERYTDAGEPALPPLIKRWPRMRDRGIEWTEMAASREQMPEPIRVIRLARPAR